MEAMGKYLTCHGQWLLNGLCNKVLLSNRGLGQRESVHSLMCPYPVATACFHRVSFLGFVLGFTASLIIAARQTLEVFVAKWVWGLRCLCGMCLQKSLVNLRVLQALKAAIAKAKANKVQESATAEAEKKLQELQRIADREAATAALQAASEAADAKALQAAIEKAEACSVAEKAGREKSNRWGRWGRWTTTCCQRRPVAQDLDWATWLI